MANKRLLLRRGTTAQNNAFTGTDGEITYDTEGKNLRLHDGVNAGGTTLSSGAQPSGVTNTVQTTDGSGNLTDSGVTISDAVISSTSSTFAIGTALNPADGFFDVVDIGGETLSVSTEGNLQLGGDDILTESDLVTAATQTSGIVKLSTTTLASAGVDDLTAMTPKLVRQEIDSRVNVALTSAVQYKGTFTSSTEWDSDGPDVSGDYFADAAINEGDLWYFSGTVATDVLGVTFNTGDHLIWSESITAGSLIDSTKFDKIDNTDSVSSVNGDVGAVEVDIESALEVGSNVSTERTLTFSHLNSALVINKVQSNENIDLELSADGTGDVTLVGNGSKVGSLKFNCENNTSGHNITIYSPDHAAFNAVGGGYDLTLPAAEPEDGQVLTSTANGTLSWGTPSAGVTSLEALSDTYLTSSTLQVADGHVLQYNGDTNKWENAVLDVASDSFAYDRITVAPATLTMSDKTSKLFALGASGTYQLPAPAASNSGSTVVVKAETQPINIQSSSGIVLLSDATSTSTSTNPIAVTQVMSFVSTGSSWIQTSIEENDLGSLSDVDTTTVSEGHVLTYSNGTWVPQTASSGGTDIDPLGAATAPTDSKDYLVLVSANTTLPSWPSTIESNVTFKNLSTSTVTITVGGTNLVYKEGETASTTSFKIAPKHVKTFQFFNNAFWENTGVIANLSEIDDVSSTTTPNTNDVLTWSGTEWAPAAPAGGGGSLPTVYRTGDAIGSTTISATDATIAHVNMAGYSPSGIEEIYILDQSQDTLFYPTYPAAAPMSNGYKYNIKNISSTYTVTVQPNPMNGATIDGSTAGIVLGQNSSITIVADKTNNAYYII